MAIQIPRPGEGQCSRAYSSSRCKVGTPMLLRRCLYDLVVAHSWCHVAPLRLKLDLPVKVEPQPHFYRTPAKYRVTNVNMAPFTTPEVRPAVKPPRTARINRLFISYLLVMPHRVTHDMRATPFGRQTRRASFAVDREASSDDRSVLATSSIGTEKAPSQRLGTAWDN